jgi:hypothetical protein
VSASRRDAVNTYIGAMPGGSAAARQIFSNAQVSVTLELAATVTERTEGWPVGLYPAALVAPLPKLGGCCGRLPGRTLGAWPGVTVLLSPTTVPVVTQMGALGPVPRGSL